MLNRKYKKFLNLMLAAILSLSCGINVIDIYAEDSETTEAPVEEETVEEDTAEVTEDVEETAEEVYVVTNEEYGVTIEIPEESMPENTNKEDLGVRVTEISQERKEEILELLEENEESLLLVLDISLINVNTDEEVQPTGYVKVTLPEVEGISKDVKVSRINDDETVTELSSEKVNEDGKTADVEFETEHFTEYALTDTGINYVHFFRDDSSNEIIVNVDVRELSASELQAALQEAKDYAKQFGYGDIVLNFDYNVTFENYMVWFDGYQDINSFNYTINGNGKYFNRGNNCTGTMLFVADGSSLTINNLIMNGNGREYEGNDGSSGNIPANKHGVFIHNEGTVDLNDGTVLTSAHTRSDDNDAKFVAPIFSKGGTTNLNDGAEIRGNWFVARATQGGNAYSAGAIIAMPDDSGNKSVVNMHDGAVISGNKVGWDWNQQGTDKELYINGTQYNLYDSEGNLDRGQTESGHKYTNLSSQAGHTARDFSAYVTGRKSNVTFMNGWYSQLAKGTGMADSAKLTTLDDSDGNATRTPGAGAILLFASELNMDGGEIKNNYAEVGAIGVNGVSITFKDLVADDSSSQNPNPIVATWADANVTEPSDKTATFNMTGGTIDNNLGIYTGGVYVGRYGTMNMGTKGREGLDNSSIVISNNAGWFTNTAGGISLSSQFEAEGISGHSYTKDALANQPTLNMYSGTISGNYSPNAGGIYVSTDNANIYAGEILNNTGDGQGGGIYLELGHSMQFETIVEVSNNTANSALGGSATPQDADEVNANGLEYRYTNGADWYWDGFSQGDSGLGAGGGIWMCPEGAIIVNNSGSLLIDKNTATEAGNDIYYVVALSWKYFVDSKLPSVAPNGSELLWYRDGGMKDYNMETMFTWLVETRVDDRLATGGNLVAWRNWYESRRDLFNKYDRTSESGYTIQFTEPSHDQDAYAIDSKMSENDFNDSHSMAKVIISGNTSGRGGGIGLDGILTFGEENADYEEASVAVQKEWTEGSYSQPITIAAVATFTDGLGNTQQIQVGSVELNSENGYSGTITGIPTAIRGGTVKLIDWTDIDEWTQNADGSWSAKSGKVATPTDNLKLVELVSGQSSDGTYTFTYENIEFTGATYIEETANYDGKNENYYQKRYLFKFSSKLTNEPTNKFDVDISKRSFNVDGDNLAGAKLVIYSGVGTEDRITIPEFTTTTSDTTVQLQPGTYTLIETEAPEGYAIAQPIVFRVADDGSVTVMQDDGTFVAAQDGKVVMVDRKTTLTVNKEWVEGTPEDKKEAVKIELLEDGVVKETIELNNSNNWTYTLTNLDPTKTYTLNELDPQDKYDTTERSAIVPHFNNVWREAAELTDGQLVTFTYYNETANKWYYLGLDANDEAVASIAIEPTFDDKGNVTNVPGNGIWRAESAGNGTFRLINVSTGKKLAVIRPGSNDNFLNFTTVDVSTSVDYNRDLFTYESVSGSAEKYLITQKGYIDIALLWRENYTWAGASYAENNKTQVKLYSYVAGTAETSDPVATTTTFTFTNKVKEKVELPMTGGSGRNYGLMIGGFLALVAAAFVFLRKRTSVEE